MSQHTYTLTTLAAAVTHALGKTPSSGTSTTQIVNDALMELSTAHRWNWRTAITTLDLTATQDYVTLPADFESLIDLQLVTSSGGMIKTSLPFITDLRAGAAGATPVPSVFYYAIAYKFTAAIAAVVADPEADPPVVGVDAVPQVNEYRLELWPTPSTTAADAIKIAYNRLPAALVAGADVPAIPPQLHIVLKQLCRARALIEDDQPEGADELARYQEMLAAAVLADGSVQGNIGRIQGSVNRQLVNLSDEVIGPNETIVAPS